MGGTANLTPAFFLRQHGVEIRRVRSVEDRLAAGMPPHFQGPVPLEHDDSFRIGPAGDDGGDLTPAAPEARLEPLDIHGTVPRAFAARRNRISLSTSAKRRSFQSTADRAV